MPRPTAPRSTRSAPDCTPDPQSIREFIETHQPDYFFCGHIHEAEGVVIQMGKTRAQNVGKKGYLLELSETP